MGRHGESVLSVGTTHAKALRWGQGQGIGQPTGVQQDCSQTGRRGAQRRAREALDCGAWRVWEGLGFLFWGHGKPSEDMT